MKKLKYKIVKGIATLLNCDELINWDEYSETVPTKPFKGKIPSGILTFADLDQEVLKIYASTFSKPDFYNKLRELDSFGKPVVDNYFHYEE